ncbi:MAG: hypothetical protein WA705_20875 [Candidatus Ozemobacteraceae bacterium]
MSRKRQPMRQIKEVLRLSQALGLGDRVVAVSTSMARTTVRDYIDRMSRKRAPMRRIKDILRLSFLGGLGERQIGTSVRMSKTTVHDTAVPLKIEC